MEHLLKVTSIPIKIFIIWSTDKVFIYKTNHPAFKFDMKNDYVVDVSVFKNLRCLHIF